jgi:hypothetical protein
MTTNFDAVVASTLTGALVGNVTGNVTGNVVAFPVTARTATAAPGGTTGVIADGAGALQVIAVTSDDANKVITLPTPVVGAVIVLINGATGYELRSSTPASIAINGGTGANAESAVAASTVVVAICTSATTWLAFAVALSTAEAAA